MANREAVLGAEVRLHLLPLLRRQLAVVEDHLRDIAVEPDGHGQIGGRGNRFVGQQREAHRIGRVAAATVPSKELAQSFAAE